MSRSESAPLSLAPSPVSLGKAIILPAMAAGMGWGIRGQYGHETGAMIAGVLAALTLVLLFVPHWNSWGGLRAAAWMALAIGIGGSMTYGQTVGLTHNPAMIGNWAAFRWGMVGLAVKGGLWIGFGGIFLGMGLGGTRYRPWEILLLMLALLGIYCLGIWVLNSPFDPSQKILPRFYFSESWDFKSSADVKPRPEVWGGLLVAWLGLVAYVRLVRGDRLALRLGCWAFLAGALGFPGGQTVQAYHAWNSQAMAASSWNWIYRHFNWWNMMETTFGTIWGAVLGLGVWCNQRLIAPREPENPTPLPASWELALCFTHLCLLLPTEIHSSQLPFEYICWYTQWGLLMVIIPIVAATSGRLSPYVVVLPLIAAPILQKTILELFYVHHKYGLSTSWIWFVIIPVAITVLAATELIQRRAQYPSTRFVAAVSLWITCWLYFGLNTAFFDFAWPWRAWGSRTPNQLIFMICAACLTLFSIFELRRATSRSSSSKSPRTNHG